MATQTIIRDNWNVYKSNHPELDLYKIREVERMLDCCNPDKGFFWGYCGNCDKHIIMHLKCNGKMCRFAKLTAQKSIYWMKKKFNNLVEGRRILNQIVLVKNAKV